MCRRGAEAVLQASTEHSVGHRASSSESATGLEAQAAGEHADGHRVSSSEAATGLEAQVALSESKPVVDPPELDAEGLVRDTDETPGWIPGTFPTIFQNATGDPHSYLLKKPDLESWGLHVLRSRGWRAQAHMTFMYWWTNMRQRIRALGAKKWFVKDNPKATGYTVDDLKEMSVGVLAKKMVGYTQNIPGTRGSKGRIRKIILDMVRQVEIETRAANGGLGDVPCLFGTLTSQRYHWDCIIRTIAEIEGEPGDAYKSFSQSKRRSLVNKYPSS